MDELLTIAEFAAKVGVTSQAIYKRLKTDLAEYLVEEDGLKFIRLEALEMFKVTQLQKENKELRAAKERIAELEATVAALTEEKMHLTENLAANNERLLQILERQMQLQENHQVLTAQVQQSLHQLLPPVANEKGELQTDENSLNNELQTDENKVKKVANFWKLFKKRD